ncbi:gluconokinase [Gandjariella thermophila]|nr:gluconokinase [Gandjariella thermophila]
MGVAGSGKTTVGRLLAKRLGVAYAEADDFHPAANIAKMAAGRPLSDADRVPWLAAIAGWMSAHAGVGGVVTCSALRRGYRDRLRAATPAWFLHLAGDRALIASRVGAREDHFMPAALVDSQFATLEPLQPDEPGLVVDAALAPMDIVETAWAALCGPREGALR